MRRRDTSITFSRNAGPHEACAVKGESIFRIAAIDGGEMSLMGQTRTFDDVCVTSVLPLIATKL